MRGLATLATLLACVAPASASAAEPEREIAALTARVEKLEGTRAIKKLQRAFGFLRNVESKLKRGGVKPFHFATEPRVESAIRGLAVFLFRQEALDLLCVRDLLLMVGPIALGDSFTDLCRA